MPGFHLPYFGAVDAGVFQRHGLEVEILDPEPGPANVHRVASRGADFCLTSVNHFLRAWDEQPGVAVRFVFMLAQRSHMAAYVVEGRPTATGVIPQHPRDLTGARVGGAASDRLAKEYLGFMRRIIGVDDLPLAEIPYAEALPRLGSGQFDVLPDFIDLLPRVRHKNPAAAVRAFRFADYGLPIYGSGLVTSDGVIQEQPETVERMVGAMREALEYARAHPEAGLESLVRRYPDTIPAVARDGWQVSSQLIFGWEAAQHGPGWFEPARWADTLRYEAQVQGFPLPPIEATYDTQFVSAAVNA